MHTPFEKETWVNTKTAVDIHDDALLVLDQYLRVVSANGAFYRTFHTDEESTSGTLVYELGSAQWNIPALRTLLERSLSDTQSFFKGFKVVHDFPIIGLRTMIVNARRIYAKQDAFSKQPVRILFAIEDITELMALAQKMSREIRADQ